MAMGIVGRGRVGLAGAFVDQNREMRASIQEESGEVARITSGYWGMEMRMTGK